MQLLEDTKNRFSFGSKKGAKVIKPQVRHDASSLEASNVFQEPL